MSGRIVNPIAPTKTIRNPTAGTEASSVCRVSSGREASDVNHRVENALTSTTSTRARVGRNATRRKWRALANSVPTISTLSSFAWGSAIAEITSELAVRSDLVRADVSPQCGACLAVVPCLC